VVTRWLDPEEQTAWRTLLSAHASLIAVLDRELREQHGLALADYEVLALVSESPEGHLPMSVLAQRLLISPSALTRRVDRLVQRGLVVRQACAGDARVSHAALSAQGRRRLEAAAPTHVRGVREHLVDRLSREQLAALTDALGAVTGAAPVASVPASGMARKAQPEA
jgi:DNA-binding MarR family transcriptional regulator